MKISDLKIAVISDATENRNGVGTYYHDLVDHLKEYVRYAVLLSPKSSDFDDYVCMQFNMPGDESQKLCWPKIPRIVRRIKRSRPHIIVIPTPGPYGLLGYTLARQLDIPLVVGFHTDYEKLADIYWNETIAKMGRCPWNMLNRFLFKSGEIVITNSDNMIESARTLGADPLQLVGTPIARHFFATNGPPISEKLSKVLFAGRLAPEKNLEAVLDAARKLSNIEFHIAGDGPQKNEVVKCANECRNVNYLGWVSRSKMRNEIDNCDLLVLPSSVESFGTIAMEAMARCKPVLVSKHCGILNWSSLVPGLYTIRDNYTLADSIREISNISKKLIMEKAEVAGLAAREMNLHTICQWLDIFEKLALNKTSSIDKKYCTVTV